MQGLKIPWLKNRKGSIPFSGTNLEGDGRRSFRLRCTSRIFTYGVSVGVTALVTLAVLLFAEEGHCADVDLLTPAAIYSMGTAADWSASRYALRAGPELREWNRLGVNGGAAFTGAAFMAVDVILQKKARPVWQRALRKVYIGMTVALVANSLIKAQGRATGSVPRLR